MIRTTIGRAIALLQGQNRATPAGVVYVTEPKHSKTGNPYYDKPTKSWRIEKVGTVNGFLGVSYESSVNNQLAREEKEPIFISEPIWNGLGEHLDRFLVKHVTKGDRYLKVLPNVCSVKVQYRWKETKTPLSESELAILKAFESPLSEPQNQGTDKPIRWQLINLNNVLQLTFGGETYMMGE